MNKRIVIIDDDHVIQESLQELFREAGYDVSSAADGVSGLSLIMNEKPDLVVADILLPRMHGIELCEKIKASRELNQIPIILMTGVYKDYSLRMYVHKGLAEDFIEKPFSGKDLLAKVERLIGEALRKVETPDKAEAQPIAAEASRRVQGQKGQTGRSVDHDLDELISWAQGKKK